MFEVMLQPLPTNSQMCSAAVGSLFLCFKLFVYVYAGIRNMPLPIFYAFVKVLCAFY